MMSQLNAEQAQHIEQRPCQWGSIDVYQNASHRWLRINQGHIQSAMALAQPWQPVLPYFAPMLTSLLFVPAPQHIALLGLGGGELLRFFRHFYADSHIDIVDLEAAMWPLYQQHFSLPGEDHRHCHFIHADVCSLPLPSLTEDSRTSYDLIYVDLCSDTTMPDCLQQLDTLHRLAEALSDKGVLAFNLVVNNPEHAMQILAQMRQAFAGRVLFLSVGAYMNVVALVFAQPVHGLEIAALETVAHHLGPRLELDLLQQVDNLRQSNPHCQQQLQFV